MKGWPAAGEKTKRFATHCVSDVSKRGAPISMVTRNVAVMQKMKAG